MPSSRAFISLTFALALALAGCADDDGDSVDASIDATPDIVDHDAPTRETSVDPGGVIVVDGLFDDWAEIAAAAVDPTGDASGPFDLEQVYAATRGTTLYLRFSHGALKNLHSGPDGEETLLVSAAVQGGSTVTIDLRRRLIFRDGDTGNAFRWSQVRYRALPTYAASEHELAIDLALLGATLGGAADVTFSGSDTLDAPISLTMTHPESATPTVDAARAADAAFRLMNLNTYFNGLSDPSRKAALARIVRGVSADVVCLQEEMDSTEADFVAALPELSEGSWSFSRVPKGAILASRWPMIPVPGGLRFAGGAITLPGGEKLVVFSFHPDCCGFIGSAQDLVRIGHTRELVARIAALRAGSLGTELAAFADAPVIISGDWNLVASGEPLRMMQASDGPALTHWLLRHQAKNDIYTWRSDTSDYPPGMLDLVVYDATKLAEEKGFIFISDDLDAASLEALGIESNDSAATDHLALVADFSFR